MKALADILRFHTMISPVLLQVMFWAGIAGNLYGTFVLIQLGNWAWPLALFFGLLTTRVIFECAILAFRACEHLRQIAQALQTSSRQEP